MLTEGAGTQVASRSQRRLGGGEPQVQGDVRGVRGPLRQQQARGLRPVRRGGPQGRRRRPPAWRWRRRRRLPRLRRRHDVLVQLGRPGQRPRGRLHARGPERHLRAVLPEHGRRRRARRHVWQDARGIAWHAEWNGRDAQRDGWHAERHGRYGRYAWWNGRHGRYAWWNGWYARRHARRLKTLRRRRRHAGRRQGCTPRDLPPAQGLTGGPVPRHDKTPQGRAQAAERRYRRQGARGTFFSSPHPSNAGAD
jgi:hypothetical protein